jgi:heterodisulfide reductase subunit B
MTRHIGWLNRSEPEHSPDTLEQERREVLKSVLEAIGNEAIGNDATGNEAIGNNHADSGLRAACFFLMRHLATGARPAPVHQATPIAVAPPLDAPRSGAHCR